MQKNALETLRSIIEGANDLIRIMEEGGEPMPPAVINELQDVDEQLWDLVGELE